MSLTSITRKATGSAKSAIIFIHGLGDSGSGWSWFPEFLESTKLVDTSSINFVFPNAPLRPITCNGGLSMPGWFDVYEFGKIDARVDAEGTLASCELIKQLILHEHENNNIPLDKIIVGGFSQGAALALSVGAIFDRPLGGIIGLSGFTTLKSQLPKLINRDNFNVPFFQGHGTLDPVVDFHIGEQTHELLRDLGFKNTVFKSYQGVQHSASEEELLDVAKFIHQALQ